MRYLLDVDPHLLEQTLLGLASRVGLVVRVDHMEDDLARVVHARGGVYKLAGQCVLVMDARLAQIERIALLMEALRAYDLELIPMLPWVRQALEQHDRRLVRLQQPQIAPPKRARLRRVR